jgi:hypothetical protein
LTWEGQLIPAVDIAAAQGTVTVHVGDIVEFEEKNSKARRNRGEAALALEIAYGTTTEMDEYCVTN